MASDNETKTCKQVESPGVNGNPEDVSKEYAKAGSSKFGFGFSSMRGEKGDRRRPAYELRMQMKDCISDFGSWVRQVAPTVTNLTLQNPWACGSEGRRQFTRSLLSSERNSLRKTSTVGS